MRINIGERANFVLCKTRAQQCVHCGRKIGKGNVCLSINNATDTLALKKNLLFHIDCVQPFATFVKKKYKEQKAEIFASVI